MRRTLYKDTLSVRAMTATGAKVTGTVNGDTVDRYQTAGTRGSYHGGVLFAVQTGTVTDGTHTFSVQDSDDGTAWAAPAAGDVQGTPTVLTSANPNIVADFGYTGTKRYVRCVLVSAGTTTGAIIGATAVLVGASQR